MIILSKNQSVAIANLLRKKGDNNNPVAVYKDENNELHTYSAICTHLGCTVTWDPVEKSFDCT
jgi:Rieske Fe-S protein